MIGIKENLDKVRQKIADAAKSTGRDPDEISIIAVSKTRSIDEIRQAIDCGLNILGENRAQELCEKYKLIGQQARWHMIGHLQTNKVKYILDKVDLIHSVDSLKLIKEINKRCKRQNKTMDILIQVNISGEESKFGVDQHELMELIHSAKNYKNVRIKGLMTIAPFYEDSEKVRPIFEKAKQLFDNIRGMELDYVDMRYLSMGMTNDYDIAIQEGSNMIRVGTGIFGQREY
ncbi:MAG: YggS family pyridoxal phosphate-dependent enzyme [Clostridia bacterium]|nr:YggS family pyridoxal phosphate-dependent enzyme [Clostridia bacterium]